MEWIGFLSDIFWALVGLAAVLACLGWLWKFITGVLPGRSFTDIDADDSDGEV